MKAGTASGAAARTPQALRPGKSVRSTSQAAVTPITAESSDVAMTSPIVLRSSFETMGRISSLPASSALRPKACTAVKPIGSSTSAATTMAAASNGAGAWTRERDLAPTAPKAATAWVIR